MTSPIDLVALADCKAWLGLTSTTDDTLLAGMITAISQAILADLGRAVLPATYTECFDSGGERSLPLRQWPVTSVISCTIDGIPLMASARPGRSGYVLDPADGAPPGSMQRLTLRGGAFVRGIGNVVVSYRAGYEIAAEAATVPTSPPYSVSALAPFGAWAADTGVAGAPGAYSVSAGMYTFAPTAAGLPVTISYGYVPADLARAAVEWVADRYAARTRIGQSAKTLGGQETASFIVKAMPDVVSRLLQPYRRIAR